MAEVAAPTRGGRQIIILATVATVVFFTFFLVGLRSCSTTPAKTPVAVKTQEQKSTTHVVIYSNLDLKDSALVITRLKELKIPYQIKDDGHAIAVPRAKADEARLGLAEKNLPAGGTVGWEIFDQSKLGATDFDRRIQFIRAISGELSRTIKRLIAIEDARVQIVIPETKLFEVSKAPVTASVLLKMNPGEVLSPRQVSGIVHLVSGSVENLKPENITIIDINGNILSPGEYAESAHKETVYVEEKQKEQPIVEEKKEEVIIKGEGEGSVQEVKAKLNLEDKLTSKVQNLLNKTYPPNITIARVNVDSIKTRKLSVIILVDKNFKISKTLKKETFETISAAVGYDRTRGDRITLKSVTFHATGSALSPQAVKKSSELSLATIKTVYRKYGRMSAAAIVGIALLFLFMMFGLFRNKGRAVVEEESGGEEVSGGEPRQEEEAPVIQQMKNLAIQNPEQVARLLNSWVSGEGA